ncbi:hypothetical protein BDV34DRAFT_226430 [Aspergillus parasiticus]|uniref:Uncharacterized protein n=1 Tax=Aspergillus parasiticus TaxID=5067 RepID=A0A5N6DH01_ASPPA|nr:hypothetical protein BDV34DRAFT_226430 [Aspergillus parasiticus]
MAPLRSLWAIFCTAIGALEYASRHTHLWFRILVKGNYAAGFGNFTASPEMENPKEYVGWFNCSGDKLGVGWQDSEWNLRSSGRGEARPHGVASRHPSLRRPTASTAYSIGTIDRSGLVNVTCSLDWGRSGMGGHNSEVRPQH